MRKLSLLANMILAALLGGLIVLVFFAMPNILDNVVEANSGNKITQLLAVLGTIGDFLNPIVAAVLLIYVVRGFATQREELEVQRDELKQAKIAFNNQHLLNEQTLKIDRTKGLWETTRFCIDRFVRAREQIASLPRNAAKPARDKARDEKEKAGSDLVQKMSIVSAALLENWLDREMVEFLFKDSMVLALEHSERRIEECESLAKNDSSDEDKEALRSRITYYSTKKESIAVAIEFLCDSFQAESKDSESL